MNRRNFILGLGTAATLSGAASVTGAALNNQVNPTANFQIVATDELTVERNAALDSNALSNNNNYSDTTVSAFDHANATEDPSITPNMTINSSTNGDLGMAFATPNDNGSAFNRNESFGGTTPYNGTNADPENGGAVGPIQVVNDGGATKDVGVEYILGADYNSGNMTADDVAQLFTFNIGGTKISPDATTSTINGSSPGYQNDELNTVPVDPGETVIVNFVLNYSDELEAKISSAASGTSGYGFSNNGTSTADLLDEVVFGDI